MKLVRLACAIFAVFSVLWSSVFAQTPVKPAFEVASIKPLPPIMTLMQDFQSGKFDLQKLVTTIDGARVDIGATTLSELLMRAYKLKQYQVVGPDWMPTQLFEIHAKLPEGAMKEQVPEMLQTLLEERFKLVAHRENKEQPVYALIVSKDGHKLKEAVVTPEPPAPAEEPAQTPAPKNSISKDEIVLSSGESQLKMKMGGDGGMGMDISSKETGPVHISSNAKGISYEFSKIGMIQFATVLSTYVDRPVLDMTELKGVYQVSLELSMADMLSMLQKQAPKLGIPLPPGLGSSGGDLVGAAPGAGGLGASDPGGGGVFQAVQKLGLKLDPRKAPFETLIIDRLEKNPTED
jgi:uncharacterized protein (TIGR03435 family)